MNKNGLGSTPHSKQLLWISASLLLFILLLFIAGNFPDFIENVYASIVYRCISFGLHLLFSWIPFSVGDIFYTVIVIATLTYCAKIIGKLIQKQYKQTLINFLQLFIGLELFISAFYLMWGLNYFRPPAAKILKLHSSAYTFNQLQTITRLLIDSTNANRSLLPQHLNGNNKNVYNNAVLAVKNLGRRNKALQSFYPAAKSSMFTPVINYMGTAGYFNPFSCEAQINYAMPLVSRPVTACHEMAHQMGFAREDEANFVGFLAGKNSPNQLLRYSAYYMAMQEFMNQVYRRDTVVYHQLKATLLPAVRNDIKQENEYWEHYQNQLGYFSSLFYDRFLKINNQPEGLRTYNRMINLTMAYYEKFIPRELFKEKVL